MKRTRRRHVRHAIIHLPPMRAEQARDTCCLLEKAMQAIWRAHGDAIADYNGRIGIETPKPLNAQSEWPVKDGDTQF
ncbi:hypothetical protein WDW37_17370, partial [Bdellovibrionota bacterium FG-1]